MKRVTVRAVLPPNDPKSPLTERRMWTVVLGNHHRVHFTSERDALQFQADTSRMLTSAMHECNMLLVDGFAAYRAAWPLFALDGSDVHNMRPVAGACAQHVRDAELFLDRAPLHNGPNAVFMTWKDLHAALLAVQRMADGLVRIYRSRTNGVERMRMEVLARRCAELQQRMKEHGTNAPRADGFTRSPY